MEGSPSSREARYGEVEGAPEQVYRAALTDKPAAKLFHHAIGLHEDTPKPVSPNTFVGPVSFVLVEPDRLSDLVRFLVDLYAEIELPHLLSEPVIEGRHGLRREGKTSGSPVAGLNRKSMVNKVKVDLKGAGPVGNR